MKRMYYPAARLWPDYLRAGTGLAISLGLLLFTELQSVIFMILAGLSLLFLWLGVATVVRQQVEIRIDADGMMRQCRWGLGRELSLSWGEIKTVDVRYFSTRRDGSQGWLQMTVRGDRGVVRIDSDLDGFPELVGRTMKAAEENGIAIDDASRFNAARLQASGLGGRL